MKHNVILKILSYNCPCLGRVVVSTSDWSPGFREFDSPSGKLFSFFEGFLEIFMKFSNEYKSMITADNTYETNVIASALK